MTLVPRTIIAAVAVLSIAVVAAQEVGQSSEKTPQTPETRARQYADDLERHLREWLVDDYPRRAAGAWHRDYTSTEAFLQSVEPNRRRWKAILNPPDLKPKGDLRRDPIPELSEIEAQWISLPLGAFSAEGILVVPESGDGKGVPLVIAPHGLTGDTGAIFGPSKDQYYHSYGRVLAEAGFAVLAPCNVSSLERRNRLERMCRLADTTLSGVDLARLRRLLDAVLDDPRIDPERVGIWGLSLGGRASMYWTPLEPRIKVAVVSAWFNQRPEKMVVPSDLYSCFLDTKEEHAFLRGWLTEFSDPDAISLICPRPVLIQTGKQDGIAHWPDVVKSFEQASSHYEKLGLGNRISMKLHEGGHEVETESGIAFLRRWLTRESPSSQPAE